ncbi:zinc finger protein weckle-like isoform X1 [Diorhabda carinulata]|uniref:zinc finger protein weckle-like isoform X1 n=1 Tax=Diorhabda carinulata TaxID=1163345 RepID=UPI0025A0A62C|nr:zinc finger protein weckle-like isoform X1 [Diorhabda carinulata]
MVRCLICLLQFSKLKKLFIHYWRWHKKNKIIHKLLEASACSLIKFHQTTKRLVKSDLKKCCKKYNTFNIKDLPTESLVLSENIRIFCGQDEIIRIGDNKHSVKLSFEDDQNESKEICCLAIKDLESIAESSNKKLTVNKKKLRKKKIIRKKKINSEDIVVKKEPIFEIHATKLKEPVSPVIFENGNETYEKNESRLVTSDTESCSETSKNSKIEDSKLFCPKCGSGYKTENELSEHLYIHEPFCRLCNTWFPDEFIFKQHMQLHKIRIFACHLCSAEFAFKEMLFKHFDCHAEDRLFDDILDMEQEYKTFPFSFVNNNYNTSINSILCYLKDRPNYYYYNYKFMKTICDICYKEVLVPEYEAHLQIFHSY